MKATLPFLPVVYICFLLFSGCVPIYYASNAHNVPLLKEKHEVRVTAGLTTTEDASGPDVQAAYAVGENIGLIAQGAYLTGGSESSSWQGNGQILEVGGGYFKPLGRYFVAELYGGAGLAKISNQRYETPERMKFTKPFIQPVFGFNANFFELAVSPKIAWVHYNEPLLLNYEIRTDANGNTIYSNIQEKQTFFAFEPAVTIRGGWKYVKLQLQSVWSMQDIPNSNKLSINLGLSINLAERFEKPLTAQ